MCPDGNDTASEDTDDDKDDGTKEDDSSQHACYYYPQEFVEPEGGGTMTDIVDNQEQPNKVFPRRDDADNIHSRTTR